jgi:hypothetical protein
MKQESGDQEIRGKIGLLNSLSPVEDLLNSMKIS